MNSIQQKIDLNFYEILLDELKRKYPKIYFLFTQEFYKQVTHEDDTQIRCFFKINEVSVGVIILSKNANNHHFEFPIQHQDESLIVSLYQKSKVIDYQVFTLRGLPIHSEADSFIVPIRFPAPKRGNKLEKKAAFLKFNTMILEEEEPTKSYPTGVFFINRIRTGKNSLGDSAIEGDTQYELEMQTPHGTTRKTINIKKEIITERNYFEHLAEVKKQENAEFKIQV